MEEKYLEVYYLKSSEFNPEKFARPMVMALGFFDGVHRGHQGVINTARKYAQEKQLPLAVMTFDRHSSMLFTDPETTSFRYLNTLPQKVDLMEKQKVDYLFVVEFSHAFATLSPETFVQRYLIDLRVKVAVAGFDFTFGQYGLGDMELLRKLGKSDFRTVTVPKKNENKHKISSTRIRKLIATGKMAEACQLLGHEYMVGGKLLPDQQIKIDNKYQQLPPLGTYVCQLEIGAEKHQVKINILTSETRPVNQIIQADLHKFSKSSLKNGVEVMLTWPKQKEVADTAVNGLLSEQEQQEAGNSF